MDKQERKDFENWFTWYYGTHDEVGQAVYNFELDIDGFYKDEFVNGVATGYHAAYMKYEHVK